MRPASLLLAAALLATSSAALPAPARAADPGVTATSIKLGNTVAYSGALSAYGAVGRAISAYFRMVNDQGGINGRTIDLISLDDGYSPPRTVEQTRRLVEQDEVLAIAAPLGTVTSLAVQKYLNAKKVPQLFVYSGSSRFDEPKQFPWSVNFQPIYRNEAAIYAKWILANKPNARIAVLTPDDEAGRDFLDGFKSGLGDHVGQIVAQATYQSTDPTVDSQIVGFKEKGADVFFDEATAKFAAQALRKAADLDWTPQIILPTVSNSVSGVLAPLGLSKAVGIVTGAYLKDPNDPSWADDPAMKAYRAWMAKYLPEGDPGDIYYVSGYTAAGLIADVLRAAGNDLSRGHLMQVATHLHDAPAPMLLPGITVNNSPEDVSPIRQLQMARFDGKSWVLFGKVLGQ